MLSENVRFLFIAWNQLSIICRNKVKRIIYFEDHFFIILFKQRL